MGLWDACTHYSQFYLAPLSADVLYLPAFHPGTLHQRAHGSYFPNSDSMASREGAGVPGLGALLDSYAVLMSLWRMVLPTPRPPQQLRILQVRLWMCACGVRV